MILNKIYRHYAIPTSQAYQYIKKILLEAFSGFTGVSFETIDEHEEVAENNNTTTIPEKFLIYIDNDKSTWLELTLENNAPKIYVNFRNGSRIRLKEESSSVEYRNFNIVRTAYGVCFSGIICTNDAIPNTEDNFLRCFFVEGTPNVLVFTLSSNNLSGREDYEYWYSNLHEKPEMFSHYPSLQYNFIPTRTILFKASSLIQPIDCEHLYRIVYAEQNKIGKVIVGDKTLILGARYALECNPADDGIEYIPPSL